MIHRDLTKKLQSIAQKFPVVALLGPRQSGKTTLAQMTFPHYNYVSLEDFDVRRLAMEDPREFLNLHASEFGTILDEIQHAPDLLSYIQTKVDKTQKPGSFILTGSQNFVFNETITQTLAGRMAILTLLPLSLSELKHADLLSDSIYTAIFKGSYPRIYAYDIPPADWYPNYITTYIERDVRQIKNIADLSLFQLFMKLCAGRIGQILNVS